LAEGIVDGPDDIGTIASCEGDATNVVTITVTPSRLTAITAVLERRGFVSQTSCGICGKELVEDLSQMVQALPDGPPIDLGKAYHCLEALKDHQTLYRKTRASHAAAIYSSNFELLSLAEDVGRHNALDKAIGKLFLKRTLHQAGILILSSRISYELVQKAARAKIPFIIAASRPTALAVQLADSLNMTLASPSKGSGINVYCGSQRLAASPAGQ
jgi:FdhD protein